MQWLSILTCSILHSFKITTHKMRSFDDCLLFSIKSMMLKITRKEFYLLTAMLLLDKLHLCVFTLIPTFWRGWERITQAMWLPHHHSRVHRIRSCGCLYSCSLCINSKQITSIRGKIFQTHFLRFGIKLERRNKQTIEHVRNT